MKKQQILNAASKLFFEYGYGLVSMEQVANEAKISKATLYVHFSNKSELFKQSIFSYQATHGVTSPRLEISETKIDFTTLNRELELFLRAAYEYYTQGIIEDLFRLLITEVKQFPELFALLFTDENTKISKNLAEYLATYAGLARNSAITFNLACQILDMLRGATLWVKLVQNPHKQAFLVKPDLTVSRIYQSSLCLIEKFLKE